MCQTHHARKGHAHTDRQLGRADGLEHGHAHDEDHQAWTRRDFLVRSGLAAAGASILTGAGPAQAAALAARQHPGLVGSLAALETDRVLVLVQLQGGNDGLNTIIPVQDPAYFNSRPGLALAADQRVALDGDYHLHRALEPLVPLWNEGEMAVVHSVGYDNHSLSHFKGIDVWASARRQDGDYGWTAQATRGDVQTWAEAPGVSLASPPSVQIGTSYPLLLQRGDGVGGMTLTDPSLLDRIEANGGLYETDTLPATAYGESLRHVRQTANDADRYSTAMQRAVKGVTNRAEYPNTKFGRSLASVARLIKGRLDTRVYLVQLGSFDTHAGQAARHQTLLDELGRSLGAFYRDLEGPAADRTLTMTFSEFGRRVEENGSAGTDHGTSAPVMLFGPSVGGGFYGQAPNLSALDRTGNMAHTTDFRQVYQEVLTSWLGLRAQTSQAILGASYQPLSGLVRGGGATATDAAAGPLALDLGVPSPNPVRSRATVAFSVGATADRAELSLFDATGRQVLVITSGMVGPGRQQATLDVAGLATGVYVLRLQTSAGVRAQPITVVR